MNHTVIRVYDTLGAAQAAREELLRVGFAADSVQVSARQDEAGPVEGNFVEDQKDMGTGPGSGTLRPERHTDAYNDDTPIWRGDIVLTVEVGDDNERRRASDILDRSGAIDVDTRTSGRSYH